MVDEGRALCGVREIVPHVGRDVRTRLVRLALDSLLEKDGEVAVDPHPCADLFPRTVDARDEGRAVAPLVVLAGRAVPARERADDHAKAHVRSDVGKNTQERVADSELRRRFEKRLGHVGLLGEDAQVRRYDAVALGEVELRVGRRDHARMGKRLEIVGHDGRRVQDGRALSGLHDWSRLPRLRLTGVDSGVQRGRQQAVVVETPLVVPERLLSERGRHAARQRGHLRRRRVEAEGVGNARLLVLVVGACDPREREDREQRQQSSRSPRSRAADPRTSERVHRDRLRLAERHGRAHHQI